MNKIGIICKTGRNEPQEILQELLPLLRQKGCEAFVDAETQSANIKGFSRDEIASLADVILVLGGDGTMSCQQAGIQKAIPILGIAQQLGFITEVSGDEFVWINCSLTCRRTHDAATAIRRNGRR
jgi:NAD kinase